MPHKSEVFYLKGKLVKRPSITELMGRGIVFCSFNSDQIYQLEDVSISNLEEFEFHYSKRNHQHTTHQEYADSFLKLKHEIDIGRFEKVVLTKIKKIPFIQHPSEVFLRLKKKYLNTFNYLLSSPELGTWMGATPEKLCEIEGKEVTAISLAGTKSKNEKWTDKEIEEQLYVTRFIKEKLASLHCRNVNVDGPHSINAGPVQHLHSSITAELMSKEIWRKVIEDLHPTPATCGIPSRTSREFINKIEGHDRVIYTGFIGIFEETKKSCFVNLRCMELFENEAALFVGGGITKSSELDQEWNETERKASTLEDIIFD